MPFVNRLRVELSRAVAPGDVPQANLRVVAPAQQVPALKRRPAQPVTFGEMSLQSNVRLASTVRVRLARVFGVIEDVHVGAHRLRRQHEGVLRHVSRAIHLPIVINVLHHLHLGTTAPESPGLTALVVVLSPVHLRALQRQLRLGNHEIVLFMFARVRP